MKRRRDRFIAVTMFGLVLGAFHAGMHPVVAQQPPIDDPRVIGRCLCLAPTVEHRKADADVAVRRFEEIQAQVRSQEEIVDIERGRVDVNDTAAVDGFRRRLNDLGDLRARLEETAYPAAVQAIARYNQAVGEFNPLCTIRPWDADALARARVGLACPAD
jgi:hypothetical protein